MSKRVAAVAAVVAAALVCSASPASAQAYPPPVHSITVDDARPAPGQDITVTLQTCRPGTIALIGIDLALVATPTVGADGVARTDITVPRHIRPGRHTVSGLCVTAGRQPLFLTTTITVTPSAAPGGPGGGSAGGGGAGATGGGGTAAPAVPEASATGAPAGAASQAGGGAGGRRIVPGLAGLGGPAVPDDAASLFEDAAEAAGVTDVTDDPVPAGAAAERSQATGGGGPGLLSTLARVALGVAALGGVPVALAVSRRPQRLVRRRGFA
ncbi:MAG TPA: hypothetical protein VFZ79_02360 [Acidimicrobiales bacterium]